MRSSVRVAKHCIALFASVQEVFKKFNATIESKLDNIVSVESFVIY